MHRYASLWRSLSVRVAELLLTAARHNAAVGSDGTVMSLPVRLIALGAGNVSRWHPLLTIRSLEVGVTVHDIYIFERQRLGLEEEEVDDGRCDEVASEEDESEGVTDAVGGVGGQETDQEVAYPKLLATDRCSEVICSLPSQLNAVARDACFARVRSGNVSPITTQTNGPHVAAKLAMNMQAATIITIPETSFSVGGRTVPMMAKMRSQTACQRPPMTSGTRRPIRSMR
jgi:hypothetical protein